jgi:hypothetical protein
LWYSKLKILSLLTLCGSSGADGASGNARSSKILLKNLAYNNKERTKRASGQASDMWQSPIDLCAYKPVHLSNYAGCIVVTGTCQAKRLVRDVMEVRWIVNVKYVESSQYVLGCNFVKFLFVCTCVMCWYKSHIHDKLH